MADTKEPKEKKAKISEKKQKSSNEKKETKEELFSQFSVGDVVKVNYKILEAGKTRIQPFEGTVISKKGMGVSKTFTVRKIANRGIGVERIFPIFSPNIDSVDVARKGKVRRAKLYYLREQRSKKEAKIKELAK